LRAYAPHFLLSVGSHHVRYAAWTLLFFVAPVVARGQNEQPLPSFVEPTTPWGGQLVPESVPYQPSALFVAPSGDQTPILLDQLPPINDAPVRVAGLTTDTVPLADDLAAGPQPQLPPGTRNGVFQKMFFTGTWLPQLENDSLGWGDLETGIVFGFPFFRRDTPLLVTPRFGVHLLDGPTTPDLPAQVYDTSFEFRHMRKFGDGPWAMDAAVTLGYYSDFERSDSDAFRVTGYGLGVYESSTATKWVLGVAYYNRAGTTVLPIGGVIYEPSPDMKWELIVPRPRIAWRMSGGIPDSGDERWFYIAGEFGGGVWSIVRPTSQTSDLLTSRDYRIVLGCERKIIGGISRRYELGYVFGRELEFDSGTPDVSLDDTLFVRAGITY